MTRWVITGADGQLGTDLQTVLGAAGESDVHPLGIKDLDITDPAAVRAAMRDLRPGVLLNAAAHTAVDAAETEEPLAYAVNAQAPAWLATETAALGAQLVHVSTDYVFDGTATEPYEVDAPTGPATAYGRTKLAGELAVREIDPSAYIVRTAWVYGRGGGNFVKTMLNLAAQNDTVNVVTDQVGAPTWSFDLATGLVEMALKRPEPGMYHYTDSGQISWFEFAQAIFAEAGLDPARVLPTTSEHFVRPAPRPAYSVLSLRRWIDAGLTPPPDWRTSLAAALPQMTSGNP